MKKPIFWMFAYVFIAGSLSAADLPASCYKYKEEAEKFLALSEKMAGGNQKEIAEIEQMRKDFNKEFEQLKPGVDTDTHCKEATTIVEDLYKFLKKIEALGEPSKL